ncbi:MAG: hypothetical protein KBF50_12180 [Steroidobacteraceae bacterium]|nr:hypothetical protein [Steroidobacteraceae bacterium]
MKHELQETERGRQAAELLAHPLLKEALDAIEAEVVSQWGQCPARDHEGKEALWQLYKTAQKFRGVLTGYVDTGKVAAAKLRRIDENEGRLRQLLRRA